MLSNFWNNKAKGNKIINYTFYISILCATFLGPTYLYFFETGEGFAWGMLGLAVMVIPTIIAVYVVVKLFYNQWGGILIIVLMSSWFLWTWLM